MTPQSQTIQGVSLSETNSPTATKASKGTSVQSAVDESLSFFSLLEQMGFFSDTPLVKSEQTDPDVDSPIDMQETTPLKQKTALKSLLTSSSESPVSNPSPAEKLEVNATVDHSADDMWVMDFKRLQQVDWQLIQQWVQVPSNPIPTMQNLSPSLMQHLPQGHYSNMLASKELRDLLEQAYKTQRPIRLDVAQNASIILRLRHNGGVSAEFVPQDQAAAFFYQQNLQDLKQRLDDKQLPYEALSVRNWQDTQQEKKQQSSEK